MSLNTVAYCHKIEERHAIADAVLDDTGSLIGWRVSMEIGDVRHDRPGYAVRAQWLDLALDERDTFALHCKQCRTSYPMDTRQLRRAFDTATPIIASTL